MNTKAIHEQQAPDVIITTPAAARCLPPEWMAKKRELPPVEARCAKCSRPLEAERTTNDEDVFVLIVTVEHCVWCREKLLMDVIKHQKAPNPESPF